jgi:hypothetical protein
MFRANKLLKFYTMKDLKNLTGAKMLSKKEQQFIKGGKEACDIYGHDCHEGYSCYWTQFDSNGDPIAGYCVPYLT